MEPKAERAKYRPFHETIVGAIKRADSAAEIANLAELIKETIIPDNHANIVLAWDSHLEELGLGYDFGVPVGVLIQEQESRVT